MSFEPPPPKDGRSEKFASLTAGLLARKGEAEPALEPFLQARAAPVRQGASVERALDGLNISEDAPRLRPQPRSAPRVEPRFAENCPREKIAGNTKRAAVTFRLSVPEFLRLKLASAELEQTSQDIIIAALEAYLDAKGVERLDDCRCLRTAANICGRKE